MGKKPWVRVSNHDPCPVCKRPDWCCISADGMFAKCMRVDEGCLRRKEDRNGAPYYLHRLQDGPPRDPPPMPPSGTEAKRADADSLHEIYSNLLARLTLSQKHREALRQRGLTDEAIDRCSYRTMPRQGRTRIARDLREAFGDKILRVPGFVIKEGEHGPYLSLKGPNGILVPCRDRAGRIVALKVRRDEAEEGSGRYVYISSAGHGGPGPGSPVHVPAGMPERAELVRLTEGELKSDVIWAKTELPTLSAPGATGWRAVLPVLEEMGCQTVWLAFDADCWDNPVVARALSACVKALREAGYQIDLEHWDAADGKGLDDLLAAGKEPELVRGDAVLRAVEEILAAATAGEDPAEPDQLVRLQEILEAGGAEALFRDRPLIQALADLSVADPGAFAAIRASIRKRVSLRDLENAIRPLRPQANPPGASGSSPYYQENGCTYRIVATKDGEVSVLLCNFAAQILEDVVHDDGAERSRHLALGGTLANGSPLPCVEVPAADFPAMNWIMASWGTRAVVQAGMGTKDHLRAALQTLSGEVPTRTVYRHTGWRKIGEEWFYLHAGGALGTDGSAEDTHVQLPEPLAGFDLPRPPVGDQLREAVRASLGMVKVGPERITYPLLGAVYRAVLGETDFGVHLAGPTGCFKSEAAALAQQHFGPEMDARHLPANWSSTGNALEALAFAAKDAVLVVDDFCPTGSVGDIQRTHRDADRVFRGQGNRAGRQRLRADTTHRPAKPPRGLVLSTGEDIPRGQSLRARLFVLEVSPGDLGPQLPSPNRTLTACQADAREGKYAAALAGFLAWVVPRYEEVRVSNRSDMIALREKATAEDQHARTPGIVADLALGLQYFLDFARDVGAITEDEREVHWDRGWKALLEAAAQQAATVSAAEPAGQFLRLLEAAVAGGYAHLANKDGNEPPEPHRWGWRSEDHPGVDGRTTRHRPQGKGIGWVVEGDVFLEPETSYAIAQGLAREQGDPFAIAAATLRRRLKEKGLLATTDAARGKLTVRKTLQGARRDVLHVRWDGALSAQPTSPIGPQVAVHTEQGPISGAGSGAETTQTNGQPAHKPALENGQMALINGSVGRLGRSNTGEEGTDPEQSDHQNWGEWQ